jgi:hypothetical protein
MLSSKQRNLKRTLASLKPRHVMYGISKGELAKELN